MLIIGVEFMLIYYSPILQLISDEFPKYLTCNHINLDLDVGIDNGTTNFFGYGETRKLSFWFTHVQTPHYYTYFIIWRFINYGYGLILIQLEPNTS
jgi:hypothetical protein